MTDSDVAAFTPVQRKLAAKLRRLTDEMTKAQERVTVLTEKRRHLMAEAYESGINTLQLAPIVGMSTEAVRQNLSLILGRLRNTVSK